MKRILILSLMFAVATGCDDITHSIDPDLSPDALKRGPAASAKKAKAPVERPFKMSRSELTLDWGIERHFELACGGAEIAGGESSGVGNFTHLGRTEIHMSAAWDIGARIADPNLAEFTPVSPAAAGPFAPVFGPEDYPYHFQFNPFTGQCEHVVRATGELLLTAANGDQVFGMVMGGETHRLDFTAPDGTVAEGSGVETFAIVEITGGSGRFADATGQFVIHTITRFDFVALEFVIDLAEVLPGGTIAY